MEFLVVIVGIISVVVGVCDPKKRIRLAGRGRLSYLVGGLMYIAGLALITIRVLSGVQSASVSGIVFIIVGLLTITWAFTVNGLLSTFLEAKQKGVIVGVGLLPLALGVIFIVTSSLPTGGEQYVGETRYEIYSKYGFSMEYPAGMLISEEVSPDESLGKVTGYPFQQEQAGYDSFTILWETFDQPPDLADALEYYFQTATILALKAHRPVNLSAGGEGTIPVRAQAYTSLSFDMKGAGVIGAWYCESNKRLYGLGIMTRSGDPKKWAGKAGLKEYERYLESFECFESFNSTKASTVVIPSSQPFSAPALNSAKSQPPPKTKDNSGLPLIASSWASGQTE